MILSRNPLYVPFLIGGVLASQVVPTFGAQLGLTGNWLPFFSGLGLIGTGVALYLLQNKLSDRAVRLTFVVYWVLAVGHTLALLLVYSDITTIAEYADLVRWLSVPIFILAGFVYGSEADGPLRGLFRLAVLLLSFTALLFVDFMAGPWSGLQRLYVHRQIGLGRFPGNWNYPYDLSVALFFYILAFVLAVVRARKQRFVALSVVAIVVCALWIVAGQSRGSLLALGIVSGVGVVHSGANSFLRGRVSASLKPVTAACVTAAGILLGYAFIGVPLEELLSTYASRLVSLAGAGLVPALESPERAGELRRMVSYFSDSPLNLLWGFGPYRGSGFWIQNILLLIFRYGLLGFAAYVLFVPMMTVYRGLAWNVNGWRRRVTMAYLYWLAFIFVNSISHDIFTHYRFMPLFYFVSGVLLALPGREAPLILESPEWLASGSETEPFSGHA